MKPIFMATTKGINRVTLILTGFSLLMGCQPKTKLSDGESSVEAISNRPQSYDRVMATLKLSTPSLLQAAYKDPVTGQINIKPALKEQIEQEQASAIGDLATLSPEIKVLYRYRMVLNGLTIVAPKYLESKILGLPGLAYVENSGNFERLVTSTRFTGPSDASTNDSIADKNSASFIGAYKIRDTLKAIGSDGQEIPLDGRGMRVGVIDTGIDYTHSMLGGAGTVDAYHGQNKDSIDDGGFPNLKVVGGYDFVGSTFNSAAPNFDQHIPRPDQDPIDEGGHGTHVAGSIAGIGNGVDSYNGVAAGASLFALKVFGANGSTNDGAVIAALEYAADPDSNLDPSDRLDVINMSLGSGYGTPHVLYNEAIRNLTRGDVVVVASAGNSGEKTNIVGAPSTSDDALSVAASIDDMSHNWQFRAVEFTTPSGVPLVTEAVESSVSKPISDIEPVSGPLVYLGTAATDFTEEQRQAVRGKVALMDRGEVAFAEKIKRAAEAGAIGIVVANNQPGEPFTMGGEGTFAVPAIMVSQSMGQEIRKGMLEGDVVINFVTTLRIQKPELIDTLTGFTSRGPRSIDGFLKPEIAAPGANIISAKMGGGAASVKLSGTSMAAPHMAGVMALLKQKHPKLTVHQLKSLAISTATTMKSKTGVPYPVAYAGAGRVQAFEAVTAPLVVEPATISLGEVYLDGQKSVKHTVKLTNISDQDISVTLEPALASGLSATIADSAGGGQHPIDLKPGASISVPITFLMTNRGLSPKNSELDGFINLKTTPKALPSISQKLPVLAVVNQVSRIKATELKVQASSADVATNALAHLTLENQSQSPGTAMLFNLIAEDPRQALTMGSSIRSRICDLESAGWRLTNGKDAGGFDQIFLEFGVKLYSPLTTWNLCEISIQIDSDGDGRADQELLGTSFNNISGNDAEIDQFSSALTDAYKMASIRRTYELQYPKVSAANYSDALVDKQPSAQFPHSTIAVVRADLQKLKLTPTGDLRVKIAALSDPTVPDADDFLLGDKDEWRTLLVTGNDIFENLTDVALNPGEVKRVELTKGPTPGNLLVYLPYNPVSWSPTAKDQQSLVVVPTYQN